MVPIRTAEGMDCGSRMIEQRFHHVAGTSRGVANAIAAGVALSVLGAFAGCSHDDKVARESWITSFPPRMTVAVAPALNFSGCSTFDPVKVADLMASELSTVPGVGVVGVSRVLAVLAEQGVDQIQSPLHALEVCDRLGADRILVFAICEYDAYTPVVGIAAQMYGKHAAEPQIDPLSITRNARPFAIGPERGTHPLAQVQRTFNARHDAIREAVQEYAEARSAEGQPYGWKKYLASQQLYMRFCCFRMVQDLLEQQGQCTTVAHAVAVEEFSR